jgi:hypothetical protein
LLTCPESTRSLEDVTQVPGELTWLRFSVRVCVASGSAGAYNEASDMVVSGPSGHSAAASADKKKVRRSLTAFGPRGASTLL